MIQAHARNIPLQYLAPAGLTTPTQGLSKALVLKDSPLQSARDLDGKTIASPALHDINSAILFAWIDKNGGDSKSVHEVEVPSSAGLPFLEDHRADVVMLVEPGASQALASGKVREFANPYSALGTPVIAAGFAVLAPAVAANRDVYARFAQALHEASMFANAHPDETADVVASFTGTTADVVRRSTRNTYPDALEGRALQPLIDICAKYGLIDKAFPATEIISPVAFKR